VDILYAVISFEYWSRRFGRDPGVIGRTFRNANDVYQIVGVSPQGLTGTETGTLTDVFLPTMMNARAIGDQNWQWFRIWVRLKPGATPELVHQVLRNALLGRRQEQAKSFPPGAPKRLIESFLSQPLLLKPAGAGVSNLQRTYRQALAILAVLVGLVLLISCANVANLMTAQAAMRAREMALRVSIGAGRARLIQLVLVESGLLAGCASALGILFAWRAAPFVVRMINPPDDPARLILPADWRVTSFAVAMTFAVTVLFGLAPVLRASSVKPASTLKGGNDPHSRRRLMNALIAAQVAFCFLVHFVAGLFISTFDRLEREPLGFPTARVLTLDSTAVPEQPADRWYQVLDRVGMLGSVESAAVSGLALMSNNAWDDLVWANGHSPEGMPAPSFLDISPGWFDAMQIPLIDGRDLRSDDSYPDVAVVNETFARRYFDGRSPVGSALETIDRNTRVRVSIVGYVRDARYNDIRRPVPATIVCCVTPNGRHS
jgi:predicted permease